MCGFYYLLLLKCFAYFNDIKMQRKLLLFKEIHNYNITLAWSVLKKNIRMAADLQNVPSNFSVQILNNLNPVKEVLKECPL